nr:histidine kinase [uncultured Carboxylicivirga sp.]
MKNLILKTSLLVCFLTLFVYVQAKPTKLPPLKLKKGDTFSYQCNTTTNDDNKSEQTYWLTLHIIDINKDVYYMTVEIDRYKINNASQKIDTKFGCYNEFESPLIQVPVPFQISKDRKISNLHLPKEVINKRSDDFAAEDLLKKMQLSMYYQQHEIKLKKLIESVFACWNMPDAKNNDLTYYKSTTNNQYEVKYLFEADSVILSKKIETTPYLSFPKKENIEGTFIINPKTGLSTEISYSIALTQKMYVESYDMNQIVTIQPYTPNKSVTLTAEVADDYNGSELHAYLINNYFIERDLFKWRIDLEKGKTYSTTQDLLRPLALNLVLKDGPANGSSFCNLLLEPGDSITININNDSIYFTGKGALKNKLKRYLIDHDLKIDKEWDEQKIKQICEQKNIEHFAYINKFKWLISDWASQHLEADIYYGSLFHLMHYYYYHNDGKVNASSFDLLFNDVDLTIHSCITSFYNRTVVKDYLYRKALIMKGHNQNMVIPEQEEFYLAEMLLSGEAKYMAQTDIVWQALNSNDTQIGNHLFQEYKKQYWQSEFYKLLNNLYVNRVNLGPNQSLPEVTFTTIDGKRISTNDLKGKYFQLLFINIEYNDRQKTMEAYQKFKTEMDSKQFELITVFVTPDKNKIKEYIKEHKLKGILVSNPDWHIDELKQFNMEYGLPYFLVNPDGVIIFSGAIVDDGLEYFLNEVKKVIQQTDFSTYEAAISKRTLYSVLLVALLVILIIVVASILVTRNIKRKDALQRQQLEWQISAVRSQLNPHFLFNAMNSIQFLVNQNENKKANLFLSSFAKLMRKVLYQAEEEYTSLNNELDTIQKYLELEQLRHKFIFNIDIDPAIDAYNTEIPVMLIQPFVENAIIHGIAELKDKGIIEISITQFNQNQLKICICDNGAGLNKSNTSVQSNGKGINLTQKRMELLMQKYQKGITFEVSDRKQHDPNQKGTIVNIHIETEA